MGKLAGQVAVVTGASKGIGAGIAKALGAEGASVVVNYSSSREGADRVVREITANGGKAIAVQGDVSKQADITRLFETTKKAYGKLNILVNNAGITRRAPAIDFPVAAWNEVLDTNLTSLFRLCQQAARPMLERGSGKIINMASLLSFQGGITVPAYAAAKGAVAQLTKALANEWSARGLQVNAIAPGYMATELTQALQDDSTRSRQILERIPAGRWGSPQDVAGAAVFLASPASDYINGHILVVDGGWMAR